MSDEHAARPNQLTAVIFKEEDHWVAMFIEKYIGTQGRTWKEAMERLRIVYRAELDESIKRTGKPFGGIMESPEKYREKLEIDPSATSISIYDKGYSGSQIALLAA